MKSNTVHLYPIPQCDGSTIYGTAGTGLSKYKPRTAIPYPNRGMTGLGIVPVIAVGAAIKYGPKIISAIGKAADIIGYSQDNVITRARDRILSSFRSRGFDGAVNASFGANKLWHADIPKRKFGGKGYAEEWGRLWNGVVDTFGNMNRPDLAEWFANNVPVYSTTVHPTEIVDQLLSGAQQVPKVSSPPPAAALPPPSTALPPSVDQGGNVVPLKASFDTKNLLVMGGITAGVIGLLAISGAFKKKAA